MYNRGEGDQTQQGIFSGHLVSNPVEERLEFNLPAQNHGRRTLP